VEVAGSPVRSGRHITAAITSNHLDDAVAALSVKLSDEEAKKLEEPYRPHAVSDHE
jgi:hypothetical protein